MGLSVVAVHLSLTIECPLSLCFSICLEEPFFHFHSSLLPCSCSQDVSSTCRSYADQKVLSLTLMSGKRLSGIWGVNIDSIFLFGSMCDTVVARGWAVID